MEKPVLNAHHKQEYPPMHSAEHLLNQTMIRLFGCGRSVSAHIERKKSKMDFALSYQPTEEDIKRIEDEMNAVIARNMDVHERFITQTEAQQTFDLTRLPENASEMVRVIEIGDYDACLCAGIHVRNTQEIGTFKIISTDYQDGLLRIRFKLLNTPQ